jgi:2-dehydro-3-deoxyglucarate aldolase
MNKLKRSLNNNKITYGAWMQIPHPSIAEILAVAGFEWICVDLEHGTINIESLPNIFAVIEKYNCVPVARLPFNDPIWIHRVLDAGAQALIIPMVESKEDAQKAIIESKYPPLGKRGFGYSRANLYGHKFDSYAKEFNNDITIILQIESISAIDNLEGILSVPGFDGTLIGPYDLSGSLGDVGNFENEKFKEALKKYLILSEKYNKPAGLHIVRPNKYIIDKSIQEGYKIMPLGTDAIFLQEGIKVETK